MSNETTPQVARWKIMVADDDEMARGAIRVALQRPEWEVFFCVDGFHALDFCQNQHVDLAILDVNMPGPTGVEICSWIKKSNPRKFTPVILLTAERKLQQKIHGLNCGADEYLTKPFKTSELIAHIEAMLRIKALTEELRITRNTLSIKEKQVIALQLAGAAAHELGQPLTQMMIACQTIPALMQGKDHGGADEDLAKKEELREELESLLLHCNEMKQIIQKMTDLTEYKTKAYLGDQEIIDGLTQTPQTDPSGSRQ